MPTHIRFFFVVLGGLVLAACGSDDGLSGPLEAPTVDAVDSPTSDNPVTLTGTARAGAMIQVRGGADAVATAAVAADGSFSIDVPLRPDVESSLLVSQIDGAVESEATAVTVLHDGIAPDTPVLDPAVTPTRRTVLPIRGSAEAGTTVAVRGASMEANGEVDASGRFDIAVTLLTDVASITQNDLEVFAIDEAGNESSPASVTIVHNPTLPLDTPLVDVVPAATRDATVALSGEADPDVTISVAGGAMEATGTADGTGSFSLEVELSPNTLNTLNVFATVPATGVSSMPATVLIRHDDIIPDPPSVDPVASPTGGDVARLTGSTEAMATIEVSGGAAETSTTADGDGAFSVDVMLTADSANVLQLIAIDVAGNVSDPTGITITQDSSLPDPVLVDPISTPTADNPITISGLTTADVVVDITGGAAPASVTSGGDGTFSTSVMLSPNARNELRVSRMDSGVETIVVVVHDDLPPSAPMLNPIASPTNRTDIVVAGASEPRARIGVSGGVAPANGTADASGQFSVPVTIAADAESALVVVATDRAGNTSSSSTVSITHSSSTPDAPILDATAPEPQSDPTFTVTGHITAPGPGITIEISGGVAVATGATDTSTGAFSIDVTLNANAVNDLAVISVDGEIESPPALVSVTHDDTPPAEPDGGAISLGTPTLSTCLVRTETINVTGGTGAAEDFSRVRVLNVTEGSLSVGIDAGGDGSFSTSIRACTGDVLRFTATDAAGNVSAPTEMSVGS